MAREKPVDEGNDPGFPPSEPTEAPVASSTIADSTPTTAEDGLIGEATTTHSDLADC